MPNSYHVVHFIDEDGLCDIIHTNWLLTNGTSLWPTNAKERRHALHSGSTSNNCVTVNIRILYSTEDYLTASNKLKFYVEGAVTSDMQSDLDMEKQKQQSRERRRKKEIYESESDEDWPRKKKLQFPTFSDEPLSKFRKKPTSVLDDNNNSDPVPGDDSSVVCQNETSPTNLQGSSNVNGHKTKDFDFKIREQQITGESSNYIYYYDEQKFIFKKKKGAKKNKDGNFKVQCHAENCAIEGILNLVTMIITLSSDSIHHGHGDSSISLLQFTFRKDCYHRARTELVTSVMDISDQESKKVVYIDVGLPSFKSMSSTLYSLRANTRPAPPANIAEAIVGASAHRYFVRNLPFYRCAIQEQNFTTLIFVMPGQLERSFQNSNSIYVDGTFLVVPSIFYQLVTVHFVCHTNDIIPGAFFLMSGKSKEEYVSAFRRLHDILPHFHPLNFMSDYEAGLQSAAQEVYPYIDLSGCYFHFSKAIYSNLSRFDLLNSYLTIPICKRIIRMIMAFPLLNSGNFDNGIRALEQSLDEAMIDDAL